MEMIKQDMERLQELARKLEPERRANPLVNDLFEAASGWKDLGGRLLADKGYDLSGRVNQEVDLLETLRTHYGTQVVQNPCHAEILEIGSRIIAAGKKYKSPVDGYLGSTKIVSETFDFLQSEFALKPGQDPNTIWDYASSKLCVYLRLASSYGSCCSLGRPSNHGFGDYSLEDLLFMGGESAPLALPPGQDFETEADVQDWFTTVATILRDYGSDVLADRPGAFERLAQAAAERERLYVEECDRLYGPGAQPGAPDGSA